MRRSWARWASLLLAVATVGNVAAAAEVTDDASAFDKDNPFDFRFRVGYDYSFKQASIKREHEGPGQDQVLLYKDLLYQRQIHSMSLRAEAGIYHDLAVSIELPLVLAYSEQWKYDQSLGSECVYTGSAANCVNSGNSSTTNSSVTDDASDMDPTHYIVPNNGFDAQNIGANGMANGFAPGSDMVFRGPKRGGSGADLLDTLNFGLTWGVLSQKRDESKPTWIVGLEYKLSIGNVMMFDRARPNANHGVSDGLDHLVARTAVSHRFHWVDPYVVFWFDYPFVRRGDTLFIDYGPQEKNSQPQMSAGTVFGLEGVPYEKNNGDYFIAVDLNGRISAHFDGRGYSEAWELFASSPALGCETNPSSVNYNKACDPTIAPPNAYQPRADGSPVPYTGLTVIENYITTGLELAVRGQISRYFRMRAAFRWDHDQSHLITTDDVGRPNTSGGRVSQPDEFNPAFRAIIDEPGRRYRVDNVDIFSVGVTAQAMF